MLHLLLLDIKLPEVSFNFGQTIECKLNHTMCKQICIRIYILFRNLFRRGGGGIGGGWGGLG